MLKFYFLLLLVPTLVLSKTLLLERGTRKPLADVNIFILPEGAKFTTNEKGEVKFPQDSFGQIVINFTGYKRLELELTKDELPETIYLEKEYYDVFETLITDQREKKDPTQRSLKQADFLKAPGAGEDPVKAVQNLPGIASQSVSAQVVIQGSAPDDTVYSINGHAIPIVFHFGGLSSIVMPQAIEAVNFLSSGYGPEYNRALGGVIELQTRAPKNDRIHGLAYVDIFNTGGLVEGPINEKGSFFLSARQSYIGTVLGYVAQDNPNFDLTLAPTYNDITTIFDYKLTEKDRLSIVAVKSKDELQFILNEPVGNDPNLRGDFYQRTEFYRVIPRWERKINENTKLDLSLGYGDNNILFEVGDQYFDLQTTSLTQRLELSHRFSETWKSAFGVDNDFVWYDIGINLPNSFSSGGVRNPTSGADKNIAQLEGRNSAYGLYLRNDLIFDKWVISPNLRGESFSQTETTHLLPRMSATYNVNSTLKLNAMAGQYVQAPQNGEATKEFGNPDLEPEKANHYTIGFQKDFRGGNTNGFTLNSNLFYKELTDLIVLSDKKNDNGKAERYSNEGVGNIRGFETLANYRMNAWNFTLAYTYLNSLRKEPGQKFYPSEFDQTHNVNFMGSYELERWSYGTRLRYVTGNPYTPVNGSLYDSDYDVYIPIRGKYFDERYPAFFQLDFRIDRKWVYDTWILSAYLDIQNLTNAQNPQSLSYNYDYSKKAFTAGLPVLPIFGIKGEF
jgi:hypothetical protein